MARTIYLRRSDRNAYLRREQWRLPGRRWMRMPDEEGRAGAREEAASFAGALRRAFLGGYFQLAASSGARLF
jgi:hypothetical protein